MPFQTIRLQKGVDVIESPTLNAAQLTDSNLIRFYGGLVQKLGGWVQLAQDLFVGICRGLHGWSDIIGNAYLAVGTNERLEVLSGGALYDITPLVATTNPVVAFSTVGFSNVVTIEDAGYGPNAGDWINIKTQVSVGGTVLFGFYLVQSVVDPSHYTIAAAVPATATVTNGGAVPVYTTTLGSPVVTVVLANHGYAASDIFDAAVSATVATIVIAGLYSVSTVIDPDTFTITAASVADAGTTAPENGGNARIEYLIPTGYVVDTPLTGYGTGLYGDGLYGVAGSGQSIAPLRQWSLDNFGQDLIASPSNGGIYYWVPPVIQPATVMPGAPLYSTAVFVMPQAQIVVSLGAENGSVQEPLLSRWCDQGDFTDWTASATNQAGSYFYPNGSALIGGLAIGLGALIWTDEGLWSMTYLGFPLVFGFNHISTECGLVAQRCAGAVGNLVMWLGSHQFFRYDVGGGVRSLECSVWDFYWNNTDQSQFGQYHCAVNANFNEMAWFFPLDSSSPLYNPLAPLGYVKYNYVEDAWDYGLSSQYQRTAWTGHSPIGSPVGADLDHLLQAHEIGNDANGAPMVGGWTTGYFSIGDGEDYFFVDLIVPDFELETTAAPPQISLELLATNYPIGLFSGEPLTYGPYLVNAAPNQPLFIPCRARGRQIALSASWSDLGSFNRIGAIRFRYAPDGRN